MKVEMKCHCGETYIAKSADLKRGWGYSCSKVCAAIRRDFGRPRAKPVQGKPIKQVKNSPNSFRFSDDRNKRDIDIDDIHPFSMDAFFNPFDGSYADGGGNE